MTNFLVKPINIYFSFFLGLSSMAYGDAAIMEKTYPLPEGAVHFTYEVFDPPLTVNLKTQAVPRSPLETSLTFYKELAAGNIEGASSLSSDPKKTLDMWTAYRERVGATDFNKKMGEYFSKGLQVTNELRLGNGRALLLKDANHGELSAQFFICDKGPCLMANPQDFKELDQLGKIFAAVKHNELKL